MKPGTKRMSAAEKQAKGTYQACRDKPQHLIIDFSAPVMPGYLTPEAQNVWHEEIDRVVQAGIASLDSSFFADYCALAALTRATFRLGQLPQAAQLTELRKRGEILGIAGPSSRALRGTASGQEQGGFDGFPDA
jgi:hypothetical protein